MRINKRALWAATRVADRLNPITSGPSAPLAVDAVMEAFAPSLMPRKSLHQGIAAGLALIEARVVGQSVDAFARRLAPVSSPLSWRILARALVMASGSAIGRISEQPEESTALASLRSAGRLATVAALGGIVHEAGKEVESRFSGPWVPIATGAGGLGYAVNRWASNLQLSNSVIERWTEDDEPARLLPSMAIGALVSTGGRLIGNGFLTSRRSITEYMGDGQGQRLIGRALNATLWGAGAISMYGTLVSRLSRNNAKIEPAFSTAPDNPYVSGGTQSISPFDELGLQGRRYVTEVVPPDLIEEVLGKDTANHPIRVYVGVASEPLYDTARSELALREMEKLGAFDRKYLLLVSPTGTGWVDHAMIDAAEILARGDIATACIQYGTAPSFLEVQGVSLGRAQFRQLLWGVRQRLLAVPEDERPTVLVFGESLGAWSSSDVVMHQGTSGFDHYGIHRALWFGLPGLARWSRTGMREGRNPLTPAGTIGTFDNYDQCLSLTPDERANLRAIVVDHDNDPIAQMSLRTAVKRPPWLNSRRGRGVPETMPWSPISTFLQILVDAMNAMVVVPGEFKSFGHDYRADTIDFVQAAFDFPELTDAQTKALRRTLLDREVDRGERIKQGPHAVESSIQ
ncbi:MAG: hypothetical protein GEU79_15300 [Acidimicrobiia bacterium]|nr:hypothetical protein [Acidimicrobiia bacterium]